MVEKPDSNRLSQLRERMKTLDDAFEDLHRAYYTRGRGDTRVPTYEELREAAEAFVKANHEYQKARWGRVRVRLSVSKLLR